MEAGWLVAGGWRLGAGGWRLFRKSQKQLTSLRGGDAWCVIWVVLVRFGVACILFIYLIFLSLPPLIHRPRSPQPPASSLPFIHPIPSLPPLPPPPPPLHSLQPPPDQFTHPHTPTPLPPPMPTLHPPTTSLTHFPPSPPIAITPSTSTPLTLQDFRQSTLLPAL
jgi:hypothetical protein